MKENESCYSCKHSDLAYPHYKLIYCVENGEFYRYDFWCEKYEKLNEAKRNI